jgi:hypothetical protein
MSISPFRQTLGTAQENVKKFSPSSILSDNYTVVVVFCCLRRKPVKPRVYTTLIARMKKDWGISLRTTHG